MNNAHGDATDLCACAVATNCAICAEDLAQASRSTQFYQKQPYKCQTHGRYRYAVYLWNFTLKLVALSELAILK